MKFTDCKAINKFSNVYKESSIKLTGIVHTMCTGILRAACYHICFGANRVNSRCDRPEPAQGEVVVIHVTTASATLSGSGFPCLAHAKGYIL